MIPLFKLKPPEDVINFFEILKTIAAFDIVPDEWLYYTYGVLLDLDEDDVPDPLNKEFEGLGFETMWSVHNLGSLAIFLSFFPIGVVLDLLLRPLKKKSKKARIIQHKISSSIYWNSTIRLMIESYPILLVVSLVNAVDLRWDQFGTKFISSITLFFLTVCILFPFVTSAFLYFNFHKTKN